MDLPLNINIKILTMEEFEKLKMLHMEHFGNYKISDQSFENYLKMQQYLVLGAFCREQLIAYVIFLVSLDSADIIYIATHPDYRRKGIASKLLNAPRGAFNNFRGIQDGLNNKDIKSFAANVLKNEKLLSDFKIFLEVEVSNIFAINFYIKEGFSKIAIRKNYLQGKDAHLMMKKI